MMPVPLELGKIYTVCESLQWACSEQSVTSVDRNHRWSEEDVRGHYIVNYSDVDTIKQGKERKMPMGGKSRALLRYALATGASVRSSSTSGAYLPCADANLVDGSNGRLLLVHQECAVVFMMLHGRSEARVLTSAISSVRQPRLPLSARCAERLCGTTQHELTQLGYVVNGRAAVLPFQPF